MTPRELRNEILRKLGPLAESIGDHRYAWFHPMHSSGNGDKALRKYLESLCKPVFADANDPPTPAVG